MAHLGAEPDGDLHRDLRGELGAQGGGEEAGGRTEELIVVLVGEKWIDVWTIPRDVLLAKKGTENKVCYLKTTKCKGVTGLTVHLLGNRSVVQVLSRSAEGTRRGLGAEVILMAEEGAVGAA